jgi:hypothetical protein
MVEQGSCGCVDVCVCRISAAGVTDGRCSQKGVRGGGECDAMHPVWIG